MAMKVLMSHLNDLQEENIQIATGTQEGLPRHGAAADEGQPQEPQNGKPAHYTTTNGMRLKRLSLKLKFTFSVAVL